MQKVFIFLLALTIGVSASAQKVKTTVKISKPPIMKNLLDSFSYVAGFNVAVNMKEQGITRFNTVLMQKGMEEIFKGGNPAFSHEVSNSVIQRQMDVFTKARMKEAQEKAALFFENNKKRKEIIALPNGLQYEVIKKNDSATNKPTAADTVIVNYIGTLLNDKEFDNSYKRGKPAVFTVQGVIRGWTEILQLMQVGDHWKVYIPTELAYGDNPPPGSGIEPGAPLVFEIILEGIKPATPKEIVQPGKTNNE